MSEEIPKKKPFKFEVAYELFTPSGERVRSVLLRENPGASQTLVFGIENALVQENETITLRTLPEASAREHHVKLQFAPKTLARQAISAASASWSVTREDSEDGATILYVSWVSEDVTLAPGERLILPLLGVSASPEAGPAVTVGLSWDEPVVSLDYRGALCITGSGGEGNGSDYELSAPLELGVRNRRGKLDIPLRAGFLGDNRVLNTRGQGGWLDLRLANIAPPGSVDGTVRFRRDADNAGLSSKLVVALPAGSSGTHPWALGTAEQVKGVEFTTLEGWERSGPEPSADGTLMEWTFTPTADVELAPQASLDFHLYQLVTSHPSGPTHLVLRYSAVPGYWDGEIVCPIEKAPLVFGRGLNGHRSVGIGGSSKNTELTVHGSLRLDDELNSQIHSVGPLRFRSHIDKVIPQEGDLALFYSSNSTNYPAALRLTGSGDLVAKGRVQDKTGLLVPVGTIVAYAGAAAPEGWLLCDHAAHKRNDYKDLFAVIGTTYNGSEPTADDEFRVPGPPDAGFTSIIKH